MDDNGLSDPYIKFKLGSEKYKSKVDMHLPPELYSVPPPCSEDMGSVEAKATEGLMASSVGHWLSVPVVAGSNPVLIQVIC